MQDYYEDQPGILLQTGKKNAKAGKWDDAAQAFKRSAQQGCLEAMDMLGSCFLSGSGVEQSDEEAVNWFTKYVRSTKKSCTLSTMAMWAPIALLRQECYEYYRCSCI